MKKNTEEKLVNPEPKKKRTYKKKEKNPTFEVCLGVGMNQIFPEYISINLSDNE